MAVEVPLRYQYLDILSAGVADLWKQKLFTDVEIIVGGSTFHCHRVILGAASLYFNAMFSSGMRESNAYSISLQNIEGNAFAVVLQFIYTGNCVISLDNIDNILQAASMLQVHCLQDKYDTFLLENLCTENCISVWHLATKYEQKHLISKSWNFILENFTEVLANDEFLDLDLAHLLSIIDNNDLNVVYEETVCDAVIRWICVDQNKRTMYLYQICESIRFSLMATDYLERLKHNSLLTDNEKCINLIDEAFLGNEASNVAIPGSSHRQEEVLCIIGTRGRNPNPQTTKILCYSFRQDSVFTLPSPCIETGSCFSICNHGNKIYISGGYLAQNVLLQFDCSSNQWQTCSSMCDSRCNHSMAAVNDSIYILGGSKMSETLGSIERYSYEKNLSQVVGELCIPVSGMCSAVLGDSIYIFGGKQPDHSHTRSIQCFHTKTNICSIEAELPSSVTGTIGRSVIFNNKVYIVYCSGEIIEFTEGSQPLDVGKVNNFDHFGICVHNKRIQIIGNHRGIYQGFHFDPITRECTHLTKCLKVALCNIYCFKMVISKQHLSTVMESDGCTKQSCSPLHFHQ